MARSPEHPNFALLSYPFMDSFDQQSGNSPPLHLVHLKMITSAVLPRGLTPESPSPPTICISSGEFGSDPMEFSSEAVGVQFKSWLRGFSGSILPPPFKMLHEEGYTFREWRRQNAIFLFLTLDSNFTSSPVSSAS